MHGAERDQGESEFFVPNSFSATAPGIIEIQTEKAAGEREFPCQFSGSSPAPGFMEPGTRISPVALITCTGDSAHAYRVPQSAAGQIP